MFDMKNLRPGDLVFFETDGSWWDFFIMLASPNYTHVGMVLDDHRIIDASVRGVNITRLDCCVNIKVKRIKNASQDQIKDALIELLQHRGEKYGYLSAIIAGVLRLLKLRFLADKINKEWFCSELMAYVIRSKIKVDIVPGMPANNVFPDDLFDDKNLEDI